mgnify:CR=1 FL=1
MGMGFRRLAEMGLDRRVVPALAALLFVAACATPPEAPETPQLSYERPPLPLDVAALSIEQTYVPPLEAPYVEHLAPLSPAEAARDWAKQRLQATGEAGAATLTITDAVIEEVPLDTKGGLEGMVVTEPVAKYRARLETRLEVERPDGTGEIEVFAERVAGMPEGATLNERSQIWYDLVAAMMRDFDQTFEATAQQRLDRFVVYD